MKRIALLILVIITFAAAPAGAKVKISFDFFHDSLAPYGDWCEVDGYGYVWHPSGVDEDWAPYTDGYWTYTDAGWTWVSYEEFGGITYHYGRWTEVDGYGWCWVPGYEWGPAWVSWRRNDDYVGWAPLPPEARWERRSGFGAWVDVNFDIGPGHFRFCSWRDFGAPVIRNVCLPRSRNVVIVNQTFNITNISYRDDNDCVFNGGFDYEYVSHRVHRPVPALKLVRNTTTNIFVNGNRGNVFVNSPRGNALVVAAPAVDGPNYNVLTKKVNAPRKFTKQQISRGWAGLDKSGERDRLLVKMREETRGRDPKTAPARAPKPEALAVLPKKVDLEAKSPALVVSPRKRGEKNGREKDPEVADSGGAPAANPAGQENIKPFVRPERGGKNRKDSEPADGDLGNGRKGGKPVVKTGEAPAPDPQTPEQPGGAERPGKDISHKGQKGNRDAQEAREAAREKSRAQSAEKERAAEGRAQAEATRKEMEKQEQIRANRRQTAEAEAARAANAQREENARNRAIAERNAAQDRERAASARQQRDAESESRRRANEFQRRQAEDSNRRRAEEAGRQRAAEQAQARAAENHRRQASAEAAARRAAQAEAFQRRKEAAPQPPQFTRPADVPQTDDGRGKNKGKGRGKNKDKDE